jgi:3-phosphoinositide dependent protein kinase-1
MNGDISLTQALGGLRIANPDDSPASPSPLSPPASESMPVSQPPPTSHSSSSMRTVTSIHDVVLPSSEPINASLSESPMAGTPRSVPYATNDMAPFIPNSNDYNNQMGIISSVPLIQQQPSQPRQYPPTSNPVMNAPRPYGSIAARPMSGIYNHPNISGGSQSSGYSAYRYGDEPPQPVAPPHRTSSRATVAGVQAASTPSMLPRDGSRGTDYIIAGGSLPPRRSSRRISPSPSSLPPSSLAASSQPTTPGSIPTSTSYLEDAPIQTSEDWRERGAAVGIRREVDSEGRTHTILVKKGVEDFEFGRTLGEGSYSTVRAATDKTSLKEYAIKVLDKRHIIKEDKVKYVNIEKDTLRKLHDHPGIVKLYFTFQDKRSLYYVLDLAKNGELLTWLKKIGTFNEECSRFYGAQILDAIDYMHSRGVLHRDLKPENVLLDANMHVKITDFGTGKLLDDENRQTNGAAILPTPGLRRRVSFVGTAEYVSPELLTAREGGKPTDLWAFGCIIYQLLTGRPPFKGATEYLTFEKILRLDYTFPPGFPSLARDLVERLLVIDPSNRLTINHVKNHEFFKGIQWGRGLWNQPAPRLKPYEPAAEPIRLNGEASQSLNIHLLIIT